jgi:hypothetical protein
MDTNNILSIIALVISVGGIILGIINHKRIISKCNKHNIDVSLDVINTPLINNNTIV